MGPRLDTASRRVERFSELHPRPGPATACCVTPLAQLRFAAAPRPYTLLEGAGTRLGRLATSVCSLRQRRTARAASAAAGTPLVLAALAERARSLPSCRLHPEPAAADGLASARSRPAGSRPPHFELGDLDFL